jgi:hypothetical protein
MNSTQRLAAAMVGGLALAVACVPLPVLAVASGNAQIGAPGATLPEALAVSITDAQGKAVSGTRVTFAITSGSGKLSATEATTSATGEAQTVLTLGGAGEVIVEASAPGTSGAVHFTEFAASGAPGTFALLDDFDAPASPAPWTFVGDKGAQGSLTSGPGLSLKGAHLAYDFSRGGTWVAIQRVLSQPVPAAAIAFAVRAPAGIHVQLQVTDAGGQTLAYTPPRPLEATDASAWYRASVALDAPSSFWDGARDGVLHGGVQAIEILATEPLDGLATGAIDLDNVGWIDMNLSDISPLSASILPAPPGGAALFDQDLGVAIHFTQDDPALDAAALAGFDTVRMDLAWNWIETTPGVYDFSAFDQLMGSLASRGMKALFILDYGNPLYQSGPGWSPQTPAQITAFGNYAQAAAAHFAGQGVRYEVWNEPNVDYWVPFPDVKQYGALLQEAIARVHAGDPTAVVTTGGLSGFDWAFAQPLLASGNTQGAGAFGVHPYRTTNPETVSDELLLLRSLTAKTPVWSTEWGYDASSLGSPEKQGLWALRELLSERALGIPLSVYYEIRDDTSGAFGVIDASYNAKPAAVALQTFKAQCGGRTFGGFFATQATSLHALCLNGATGTVAVLWEDAAGGVAAATFPPGSTAVDWLGNALAPTAAAGKVAFAVSESGGPIYVSVP